MAADNRDWYRDWWRKKHGHVERAAFRISDGEMKRHVHRAAWRTILFKLAAFVLLVVVFIAIKRI